MPNRTDREEQKTPEASEGGRSTRTKEVAPRTVNKAAPSVPRGGMNGNNRSRRLEDRTVAELRDRAKALEIAGRSKMNKEELVRAIRRKNG